MQDLFSAFFERWDRYFVSFDGDCLSIFDSKNSAVPIFVIEGNDTTSVRTELGGPTKQMNFADKKAADTHDVIVTSTSHDEMHFRFPDAKSREAWSVLLLSALPNLRSDEPAAGVLFDAGGVRSQTKRRSTVFKGSSK